MIAYTIGNRKSYDLSFQRGEPLVKTGRRRDEFPAYEGGWVWRTREAAEAFIAATPLGFEPKVYGLRLPNGWDQDVSQQPDRLDGVHRLLNDAPLFLLEEETR